MRPLRFGKPYTPPVASGDSPLYTRGPFGGRVRELARCRRGRRSLRRDEVIPPYGVAGGFPSRQSLPFQGEVARPGRP